MSNEYNFPIIASETIDLQPKQTLMLLMDDEDISYHTVDSGYTSRKPLVLFKLLPIKMLKVIKKAKVP